MHLKLLNTGPGRLINLLWIFTALFILSCEKRDLVVENRIITSELSYISETEATGGGTITNGGKGSVLLRGICWDTVPNPDINDHLTRNGPGDGSFIADISGLVPATTYHVRAYATNIYGTSYGNNISFTTKGSDIPVLTTSPVSDLSSTSFISGGNIIFEGKENVSSRGVCWSTENPPDINDMKTLDGNGPGEFISKVSGLDPYTAYFVRAYATSHAGTAYGNTLYIKPFETSIKDIEGNVYQTVSIGTQVWTLENLKVTKYQNGDPIPEIRDNSTWNNLVTGAFCDYEHDRENRKNYGILYNWYAASDPRNIAPKGWRVASYEDYLVLREYLGGTFEAEERMINGDFQALAGGKRNRDGNFFDKGVFPYFWTSTEYHVGSTWARYLVLDGGELNIHNRSKNYGFSVRCIRD